MGERVVITGLGVVSPNGVGIKSFLDGLKEGRSGVKFINELKNLNFGCQIGGIPDISKAYYNKIVDYYGINKGSESIRFACLAGLEAWEDAGFKIPEYDSSDVNFDAGAIIGTGIGSIDLAGKKLIPLVDSGNIKKLRSNIVEQMMISGPSSQLGGILALGNLTTANSNACSTGTDAIINGYERIKMGKAKRMIVGGTDGYSPYYWSFFDNMRITTRDFNEMPESGSRPMNSLASGFVPGAGAGALLLEEYKSAKNRNAKIYAEIAGGFQNSGGQRNGGSMTAPNSDGVTSCIKGALKDAGINGADIDCISGHLTSTKADLKEIENWIKALNRKGKEFPYINSLKSLIGHCLGASGAIESIASVLELYHNFIHPNLNCNEIQSQITNLIDKEKIPAFTLKNQNLNYIAKASFGFGDVNSCLILKKITTNYDLENKVD